MSVLAQFTTPYPLRMRGDLYNSTADSAVVEISDLIFGWPGAGKPLLDIQSLRIEKRQRVFIEGPSGSGKTTLLSHLAGIVTPQQGNVSILGELISAMSGVQRDRFRADHIGFIFQMFNLIPYLSVVENVTLPCRFSRRRHGRAENKGGLRQEGLRLLARLGMSDSRLLRRPVAELSVGQQQRVAAARALMGSPELIIADEPTSSLDAEHRRFFIQLLFEETSKAKSTLIFVSHDTTLAGQFDQTVLLPEINRASEKTSVYSREVD